MYKLQIVLPKETISEPTYKSLRTVVRHAEKTLKNIKGKIFPNGQIPQFGSFSMGKMHFFSPTWKGVKGFQYFEWTYDYNNGTKFQGEVKILEV